MSKGFVVGERAAMMEWLCAECGQTELNMHGYCAQCGSNAVVPLDKPTPPLEKLLYQTPPFFAGAL